MGAFGSATRQLLTRQDGPTDQHTLLLLLSSGLGSTLGLGLLRHGDGDEGFLSAEGSIDN